MPQSRPMPIIGKARHELRIKDKDNTWRIIYYWRSCDCYTGGFFEEIQKDTKICGKKQPEVIKR